MTLRKRRRGKEEERMEGNSKRGRDGRKDVAREKKTLSPPMRGRAGGRIAADARNVSRGTKSNQLNHHVLMTLLTCTPSPHHHHHRRTH